MAKGKKEKPGVSSNKEKSLELALAAIDKAYGAGTVMNPNGGDPVVANVECSSSGCVSIDRALGKGWAKGRIIEVYGPESSGKTTLCLHAIAEVQKNGGKAVFVDAEHSIDIKYAAALGVDTSTLMVSQPDSGEQALNVVELLVRSGAIDIIVIDSVAALVPKAELEGEMGDSIIGVQSRLMSQAMRKLAGIVHKTNTIVMFINQIRMKIGVMFGSPECVSPDTAVTWRKV